MSAELAYDVVKLTPEQTEVALQKLLAERQRETGVDRLIRAVGQLLGRLALANLLAALLFAEQYGRVALGFVLIAVLLGIAQVARDRVAEMERVVAGQAAAQRLGIRERFEAELRDIRGQTWYWFTLLPLYLYLLVAQWTGWPRPWWLFALGAVVFARLVYDAFQARLAERNYLESVADLEHLLRGRWEAGEACLSSAEARTLYSIEKRQTQRQVARALMQNETIPLAAVEEELWSSIRAAHQARS